MRRFCVFALLILAAGCGKTPRQYLDAGNRYLKAQKYADASINFRNALQKDPNSAEAYYGLGQAFLEQGKPREAYAALTRAVELAPKNMDARQKLANLALAAYLSDRRRPKSLYDQLNKLAAQFLAADPRSYDGLRLKAYIALNDNQRAEALDYFRRILQVKPSDPEVSVVYAGALLQQREFAGEGERLLLDLIQKQKEVGAAYDTLYQYYSGSQRLADAENILKRKVAANPKQAAYVLQLAAHYRRAGNLAGMKSTIGALSDSKIFPKGSLLAGDFYNQSGDREQALTYYQQGEQTAKGDERLLYQKRAIATLNALGRSGQAVALIDEALREHSKDVELHLSRAQILLTQGKIDAALTELQQEDEARRNDPVVKFELGRALLVKGKPKEAVAAWQESAKLRPALLEPKIALASYALDTQRFEEALRWADQALAHAPARGDVQILRADALLGLGRMPEAKSVLTSLRQQLPGNPAVDLEFAFLTLRENKPAEAEKIFRGQYAPGQQSLRPLTGLVEALFLQKRTEEALRLMQADLAKAPGRPAVEMMLANGFAVAGQTNSAVQTLEKLAAAHPDLPQAPLRLGQLEGGQGNLESALQNFQKARASAPQSTEAILGVAEVEERLGRTDAARHDYQAVLKIDSSNLVALNNLAYLTADNGGNLDEALRMITQASQKLPKQPNLSDTLGYVYLKQKKVGNALQVLGDLARHYPDNPTFRFHHALALIESGSKEQARKELESALAEKPSPDLAQKIRQALGRS